MVYCCTGMAKGVLFSWLVCNKPCAGAGALQSFRFFVPLSQGNTKYKTSSERNCWDKMQSCETQRRDWLKYKVIVEIHRSSNGRRDWQKTITLGLNWVQYLQEEVIFSVQGTEVFAIKLKKKLQHFFSKAGVKGDSCFPSSNLYYFSGCFKGLRQCCPSIVVRHVFFCWACNYCIVLPSIYPWVNLQVYWHTCSAPFYYLPWKTTVAACTAGILQSFRGISPSTVTLLSFFSIARITSPCSSRWL